ncbi:MAG: SAM-dependent methyltransferase [Phyllobacteriaceae bacterium]|nr:SAM-dependent methyltransferase [Phyllobacteriaceae bacterium]MBA89766.1 SAM-dependent methyltransferase [Phyllobacteriaceae bacterium]
MTPQEFIAKWKSIELKERSASQSHFNDLCRLLGIDDPTTADPKGEWFTFEKGASKTTGGEGWADVWRKGCFAWEYKGKAKDLDKAFAQLLQYAIALENPPLLIVSDMDRFRVHTNWTNTVQHVHEFTLDDLRDAKTRDLLRACFEDPESLRPAKTRQMLTEEAAQKFAGLAQRLRERGHDAETVAHFVNRLVFCMFAEDVDLLPNKMFQRMLQHCEKAPNDFADYARTLFAAMQTGGVVGFERVEWFNGGLFDNDFALPLEKQDVADLLLAARLDWSEIDPSILGTLFERGLDPDKRSQLGAHYTDRDKIMMIVNPIIVDPLLAEWAEVKTRIETALRKAQGAGNRAARTRAEKEAERLHSAFIERLKGFRVLDPACGSGNFLYLSLLALKDIEHRVNLEAEALGLPRGFPTIGPECVKGIELNPYAAELARVSVWIGEIQWMRRNGFDAARNPILRPLGTIECRDAVLNADGTRADWPEADVVVGNPPFLGGKRVIGELGRDYVLAIRAAYRPELSDFSDLVCYWFAKAWWEISKGRLGSAGLVSTNSIRDGSNRKILDMIVSNGSIFEAWSDQEWTVEGAAVRVSLICFDNTRRETAKLDGAAVGKIHANLTARAVDVTQVSPISECRGKAFIGVQRTGPFDIPAELARNWLTSPLNPNGKRNSDVLRRYINGSDIVRRTQDNWIIDFGSEMSEAQASLYEKPFQYAQDVIFPVRQKNNEIHARTFWWRHWRPRPELFKAASNFRRIILTPRVSKHRLFVWRDAGVSPDSRLVAIARDDDTTWGTLSSHIHEVWTFATCSWHGVGNDPTYNAQSCFETFPFPEGLTPNIPAADYFHDPRAQAIAAAAARLNELRENWLNPPDLVEQVPEVVPGYPDRLLPKDDAAAKELKKRTLTNLYNARPAWLDHAHRALDEAVAEAYGWGDDYRAGKLTDDEILSRLFRLNQERAAKQGN